MTKVSYLVTCRLYRSTAVQGLIFRIWLGSGVEMRGTAEAGLENAAPCFGAWFSFISTGACDWNSRKMHHFDCVVLWTPNVLGKWVLRIYRAMWDGWTYGKSTIERAFEFNVMFCVRDVGVFNPWKTAPSAPSRPWPWGPSRFRSWWWYNINRPGGILGGRIFCPR